MILPYVARIAFWGVLRPRSPKRGRRLRYRFIRVKEKKGAEKQGFGV